MAKAKTKKQIEAAKKERAQRRLNVKIAKDVLWRMRYMNIMAHNRYLCSLDDYNDKASPCRFDGDPQRVQKNINKIAKSCAVCAKGAIFLSHVALFDNVTNISSVDVEEYARDVFGPDANRIENVFEESYAYGTVEISETNKAFWEAYPDDKERLRAIMKNVVTNKGAFKPETDPKVKKALQV